MNTIKVRSACSGDSLGIARLFIDYVDFRRAFGNRREAGIRVLATDLGYLDLSNFLVAEVQSQIAGVFQLVDDPLTLDRQEHQSSLGHYFQNLGYLATFRALTCLALGTRAARPVMFPEATFMSLLVVSPSHRHAGVGTALMAAACKHAHECGNTHLVGWVNAANRKIFEFFFSLFNYPEFKESRYSILSRLLLGVPRWVLVSLNVDALVVKNHETFDG